MKKIRLVSVVILFSILLQSIVFAVSNADRAVKVVKYLDSTAVIVYQGPLKDYDNGLWDNIDFTQAQIAMIIDWDQADSDILYIIPADDAVQEESIPESSLVQNNTAVIYQNGIIDTAMDDMQIDISLLYNNAYSECILREGQELTADIKLTNTNEASKALSSILAIYDEDSKLISLNTNNVIVQGNGEENIQNKIVVPVGNSAHKAKIMLWDNISAMNPYYAPLILTLEGEDFFGDDYTLAQPITGKNKANGIINTTDDTDVFSITPANDGLYYFETFSDIDTYASLYAGGEMETSVAADDNSGYGNNFRMSATLQANTTYYLYVNGRQTGSYTLNYGYEIGNIYGTVSPVVFYDDDTIYNEQIETTVTLRNYNTNEFVATMHLKDWSQSNISFASFSLTGVHAGEYLAEISRPGYLKCYKKVMLQDNTIDLGSTALLAGDVNGDNCVDQQDIESISALFGVEYGTEGYIVQADLNGDKVIDQLDAAIANANIGLNANAYNENMNIIMMNAELQNNKLMIAGKARENSNVTCTVYYDDYSIFESEMQCSPAGDYYCETEISKTGSYSVVVTAENQAFPAFCMIEY